MLMTPREIEDRLEEAAHTLRRVPNPRGSGPKGYGSSWPDYVRDPWHAYGYSEARMRVIPNAAEISRMEECIGWMAHLDPDDARIIWLRAEGHRWRHICIKAGCVRSTAWRRWVAALITLSRRLDAGSRPPVKRAGAMPVSTMVKARS